LRPSVVFHLFLDQPAKCLFVKLYGYQEEKILSSCISSFITRS